MHVAEHFWSKVVTVRLQNGLDHTFHSLEDSLDFLENEWPTRLGIHHRQAIDLCRSAANGGVAAEAAREALIAACLEANLSLIMDVPATSRTFRRKSTS